MINYTYTLLIRKLTYKSYICLQMQTCELKLHILVDIRE